MNTEPRNINEEIYSKLNTILYFQKDIDTLESIYKSIPFDIDDLIEINEIHLLNMFSRYKDNQVDLKIIERWANLIEMTDGYYFANDSVSNVIHDLANLSIVSENNKIEFVESLIKNYLEDQVFLD